MSHEPGRERFLQERITCEKCGDPIENAVLDDYDRYICLDCQSDEAEAAYERQQAADLESPPESAREEQLRTWHEHQKAHKR